MRPKKVLPTSALRVYILRRLSTMRVQAEKTLKESQARFKKYFDRTVRIIPVIPPGQQFFMERAMKVTQSPEERMAEAPHTKLLACSTGSFSIQSATAGTVTIREDGVENTVSIDWVSVALQPPQPPKKGPSRRNPITATTCRGPPRQNADNGTYGTYSGLHLHASQDEQVDSVLHSLVRLSVKR